MISGFPDKSKLHPLTAHGWAALAALEGGPLVRSCMNTGVSDRLLRENLIDTIWLPSPYAKDKGKPIQHFRITDAGRERLMLRPRG